MRPKPRRERDEFPAEALRAVTAVPGRRALLLCNPASGRGRAARVLPLVTAALRELGLPHRVVVTDSLDHASAEAEEAALAGEVVATVGGDGIAGRAADAVSRAGGTLAVLPAGRGNDFARAAGLPRDAVAGARVLATGTPVRHDLGEVTGATGTTRRFLGILSVGLDTEVQRIADVTRTRLGRYTYAYGAVVALARWTSLPFTVEANGTTVEMRGYTVAAANSGVYGGGIRLAPAARMDDGMLDLVLISDAPRWRLLLGMVKALKGAHVRDPFVSFSTASEVRIDSASPESRRLMAGADGERLAQLPVQVRAVPGALDVLLPARRD